MLVNSNPSLDQPQAQPPPHHQQRIIAFCGPKGSGKDSAAQYLLARNSLYTSSLFQRHNFADPLKAACCWIFGVTHEEVNDAVLKETPLDRWPFKTPRELLQHVAKLFRTLYSQDIWVRSWVRSAPHIYTQCIVVTDLRHQEEVDELLSRNAKIVYVHNRRVEQLRLDGIKNGDPLWSDASEAMCPVLKDIAHTVVENNGSFDELHTQVAHIAKAFFGDWDTWGVASKVENAGI